MNHLSNYLTWRGDIKASLDQYNEVDYLIFSILSYTHLEDLADQDFEQAHLISLWADKVLPLQNITPKNLNYVSRVSIPNLLQQLAKSPRFNHIKAQHFVHRTDVIQTIQFCAITFVISENLLFVSFRGTDETLTGWKEDMQMSYCEEVPAQRSAAIYLALIMARYPDHKIVAGGHSKGGNLALYASVMQSPENQERIAGIYNFDGPGLSLTQISSLAYRSIKDKIHTIVPKSSMIGILLEQASDYEVVDSEEVGPMQHDPFSWVIEGPRFLREDTLTESSIALKNEMRKFLTQQTREERANFFDNLFAMIESSGAATLNDLLINRRVLMRFTLNFLKAMGGEDRKRLFEFTSMVLRAWVDDQAQSIKSSLVKAINKP